MCLCVCVSAAKGAVDAGPDEGGALGADSDEEEKRANRARAASKDPGSAAESRNQSAATDVCPPLLYMCWLLLWSYLFFFGVRPICSVVKALQNSLQCTTCNISLRSASSFSAQCCFGY